MKLELKGWSAGHGMLRLWPASKSSYVVKKAVCSAGGAD